LGHFETKSDGYRCKSIGLILLQELTFSGSGSRRRVRLVHLFHAAPVFLSVCSSNLGVARPAAWTGGLHHQNLTPARTRAQRNYIRSLQLREPGRGHAQASGHRAAFHDCLRRRATNAVGDAFPRVGDVTLPHRPWTKAIENWPREYRSSLRYNRETHTGQPQAIRRGVTEPWLHPRQRVEPERRKGL
jgi:hypothetical protein